MCVCRLQRVFECMWTYRFLYRDLVDILSRNRKLKQRFARLLNRAEDSAVAMMRGLIDAKILSATKEEIQTTRGKHGARDDVLAQLSHRANKSEPTQADIANGVEQVMRLIARN